MTIASDDGKNAVLDSVFGDNHSALFPDSWQLCLFDGDPSSSGVEQSGHGYVRLVIPNTSIYWPDAAAGVKLMAFSATFAPATGSGWTVTHWALRDPVAGVFVHCGPVVDGGGTATTVTVTVGDSARVEANEIVITGD